MSSAASMLDAETVIARLEEAGRTLIALPSKGCYPAREGSSWPAIVHDVAESYGYDEETVRAPVPSPQAITRMDEAYQWITLIPAQLVSHRKIVLMRSLVHPVSDRHRFSWRKIGKLFGWSHEAVRIWHAQGIDRIVAAANGRQS